MDTGAANCEWQMSCLSYFPDIGLYKFWRDAFRNKPVQYSLLLTVVLEYEPIFLGFWIAMQHTLKSLKCAAALNSNLKSFSQLVIFK
jgi:hypothetical protein